jgi:UMF1 family MFS transporter
MASPDSEGGAAHRVALSYAGQDVRPTSRKELWGWYTYAFAAETYVICGFASFIPILLESLARENGVLRSDPTKPCRSSDSRSDDDNTCVVYVGGMQINTASFAMYVFSVSVLLQALLVVSISCAADHGNYRKKLLLGFGWIGSFSVMAFLFVSKETYLVGALLTIISNVSFGASFVLLNSFLPLLVRYHPDVLQIQGSVTPDLGHSHLESRPLEDSGDLSSSMANSVSALLENGNGESANTQKHHASHEEIVSREMDLSTQISAKGIGIGYGGALFVQCLSIGILIAMNNTTWSQRVVLFMIGAWWTIFTVPAQCGFGLGQARLWLTTSTNPSCPVFRT